MSYGKKRKTSWKIKSLPNDTHGAKEVFKSIHRDNNPGPLLEKIYYDEQRENVIIVRNYFDLIQCCQFLSYKNHFIGNLYYRGQKKLYYGNETDEPIFLPSINREINEKELFEKYKKLEKIDDIFCKKIFNHKNYPFMPGSVSLENELVRYAIIQHYEFKDNTGTPFLDLTNDLKIACGFALEEKEKGKPCYVLAFLINHINHEKREDAISVYRCNDNLVLMDLKTMLPPICARSQVQKAYLLARENDLRVLEKKINVQEAMLYPVDYQPLLNVIFEIHEDVTPDDFWNPIQQQQNLNSIADTNSSNDDENKKQKYFPTESSPLLYPKRCMDYMKAFLECMNLVNKDDNDDTSIHSKWNDLFSINRKRKRKRNSSNGTI